MSYSIAQNTNNKKIVKEQQTVTDSLTEVLYTIAEDIMLLKVDSTMNEGRLMKALDLIDSIQINWKSLTGHVPSPRTYLAKGNILMQLEEWKELVKTTEECLTIHKLDIPDKIAAIMHGIQGAAYRNLKEYREAIRSYENGLYYYSKTEDTGSQGDMLCSMAKCYSELGIQTMASSFYQKGIDKFLEYFDTTRRALLRRNFNVKDHYKQTVLGVFAIHLYNLAVYEQDYGSRLDSKNYLLMSAHCGNTTAKSEYQRIYGYR